MVILPCNITLDVGFYTDIYRDPPLWTMQLCQVSNPRIRISASASFSESNVASASVSTPLLISVQKMLTDSRVRVGKVKGSIAENGPCSNIFGSKDRNTSRHNLKYHSLDELSSCAISSLKRLINVSRALWSWSSENVTLSAQWLQRAGTDECT